MSCIFAPLLLALAPALPPQEPLPAAVEDFLFEAVDAHAAATAGRLGPGEARVRIAAAVAASHDIEALARELFDGRWEELPEELRPALERSVAELASAAYEARLDEFAGARFELDQAFSQDGEVVLSGRMRLADDSSWEARWVLRGDRIAGLARDGRPWLAAERERLTTLFDQIAPDGLRTELRRRTERYGEQPQSVVRRLQRGIQFTARASEELGFAARVARLRPLVEDTHDLAAIAKLSVSSGWEELDASQRELLVGTFSELSVATYAARFASLGDETFRQEPGQPRSSGVLVPTTLTTADGRTIPLDYLLHRREGRWRILNIVADGVSDLALKRAEYRAVLERDGFEALIALLEAKLAEQATSSGDEPSPR